MQTKFIFITGGVMSGLGKGITTSSIGRLLISKGFKVSAMKIDPYINIDAGTMRPTEHGEVFVTQDGGEVDQDLGNYERFLHKNLSKEHNLTTGKVYKTIIEKERRGDFLGKTVQIIPHLTDEIQKKIIERGKNEEILLIEIGGTVGDYENIPFLEAARQMRLKLGKDKVIFIHISFIPVPNFLGEAKTKPTQHSVKALQEVGIQPDFIVCRSKKPVDSVRKKKLALFCNIKEKRVISNPDLEIIYELPLVLEEQGFGDMLLKLMNLKPREDKLDYWRKVVEKMKNKGKEVRIGIIGKYLNTGDWQLSDSYVSVREAVKHACAELGVQDNIEWINSEMFEKDKNLMRILDYLDCVIIPGGFGKTGAEGKIKAIQYCREKNKPFLGICYGLQLAVVEYARNVCGLKNANSTEINPRTHYNVIDILSEQKQIIEKGGTMRLGTYPAVLKKGTLVRELYEKFGRMKEGIAQERHRHRYEVNPKYHELLQEKGLVISGVSPNGRLVEFIEIPGHNFFVATQAHPEFTSWPGKPNPLFYGLIKAGIR